MPRRQTLFRRLTTATRWPVGVGLTSWRYLWRTTPLYRREEEGSWSEDAPPPLPDGVSHEEVQRVGDGAPPREEAGERPRGRSLRALACASA